MLQRIHTIQKRAIGSNQLLLFFSILVLPLTVGGCAHQQRNDDESLYRVADNLRRSGNKSEAINIYKQFLEKSQDKLPIYLKLGDTLIENGQLEEARLTFEQALPLDQDNQVKRRLARCYVLAGLTDVAFPIYKEILLESNNKDVDSYNGLGMIYELKGNDKAAIKAYKTALSLDPSNEAVQSNLGLALAFKGAHAEALKWLAPIGEKTTSTPKQRHNLAIAYALAGQEHKARILFLKDLNASQVEQNLESLRNLRKKSSHNEGPPEVIDAAIPSPMESTLKHS